MNSASSTFRASVWLARQRPLARLAQWRRCERRRLVPDKVAGRCHEMGCDPASNSTQSQHTRVFHPKTTVIWSRVSFTKTLAWMTECRRPFTVLECFCYYCVGDCCVFPHQRASCSDVGSRNVLAHIQFMLIVSFQLECG